MRAANHHSGTRWCLRIPLVLLGIVPGGLPAPSQAEAPRPDSLQAILEDYRSLAVGREGVPVRDREMMLGGMDVTLTAGWIYPITTRAGVKAGLLFEGEGRFTYRADDPVEGRLLESSLERRNMLDLYHEGIFADRFDQVLVVSSFDPANGEWGTTKAVADGHGEDVGLSDSSPARQTKYLARAMEWESIDQVLATADMNGGKYLKASFSGGTMDLEHEWDEAELFLSSLSVWDPREGGYRALTAARRGGDDRGEPAMARLLDARLEVATADNRSGSIVSELTCRITREGVHVLPFQLVSHRNPRARGPASDERVLYLRRVTDDQGRALEFAHRVGRVLVRLPAAPARGATVRLRFECEGDVFAVKGREDSSFSFDWFSWYPEPVAPDPGLFTYTLDVRTRAPVVAVAPGEVRSSRQSGNVRELEVAARVPKRWVPLLAGAYHTREFLAGITPVRVHLLREDDDLLSRMAKHAGFFLDFFADRLGAYREEALDIVEVPRDRTPFDGLGASGMVLLKPHVLKRLEAGTALGEEILAHEVAHQWFGMDAFVISDEDAWLYQSAAEYFAGMATEALLKDETGRKHASEIRARWWHDARKSAGAGSIEGASLHTGPKGMPQRERLLLDRGPLVLHMLRGIAGDENFFAILRRFLARAAQDGRGTTDLLERVAGEVLGQDMGWFFDQWVRHGGIPRIHIEYRIQPRVDGGFLLEGRSEQPADDTFKKMYIPIDLEMDDGSHERSTIIQDRPVTEFRIEPRAGLRRIQVDPDHDTLALYSTGKD